MSYTSPFKFFGCKRFGRETDIRRHIVLSLLQKISFFETKEFLGGEKIDL